MVGLAYCPLFGFPIETYQIYLGETCVGSNPTLLNFLVNFPVEIVASALRFGVWRRPASPGPARRPFAALHNDPLHPLSFSTERRVLPTRKWPQGQIGRAFHPHFDFSPGTISTLIRFSCQSYSITAKAGPGRGSPGAIPVLGNKICSWGTAHSGQSLKVCARQSLRIFTPKTSICPPASSDQLFLANLVCNT